MSGWDYSESPLIDGDRLICTPGGKEAALVALNKMTGEVIWKCAIPVELRRRLCLDRHRERREPQAVYHSARAGVGFGRRRGGHGQALVELQADRQRARPIFRPRWSRTIMSSLPPATARGRHSCNWSPRTAASRPRKCISSRATNCKITTAAWSCWAITSTAVTAITNGLPFCLEWKTGKFAWEPQRGRRRWIGGRPLRRRQSLFPLRKRHRWRWWKRVRRDTT